VSEAPPPPAPPPPSWRDRLELLVQPSSVPPAQLVLGLAGVVALAVVGWLLLREPPGPPPESTMPRARAASTATTAVEVVVHAAGAVRRPGLYRLPAGSRVDDLVRAAGGLGEQADLDRINLAALVADGARVYVARVGEVPPSAPAGEGGEASTGPLDLNTATLDQLDELPGVGPSTAKAILDERGRRGRFSSVDDLLAVRGIGPAQLDALRDLVTVR
jgi:competence protein ComEA